MNKADIDSYSHNRHSITDGPLYLYTKIKADKQQ